MITINAGNITKGSYMIFKGKPHMVTKADFMSPGKGAAVMRVKYKSVETGAASEFTYKTNEQVEVADVEKKEVEFSYRDGDEMVFMSPRTYEQFNVPVKLVEDKLGFFNGNIPCWLTMYMGEPIGVALPSSVTFVVTESPNDIAGNRVNAPKKTVKLETGMEAQVPIFIKKGEKVMIDTETSEYVGRVK